MHAYTPFLLGTYPSPCSEYHPTIGCAVVTKTWYFPRPPLFILPAAKALEITGTRKKIRQVLKLFVDPYLYLQQTDKAYWFDRLRSLSLPQDIGWALERIPLFTERDKGLTNRPATFPPFSGKAIPLTRRCVAMELPDQASWKSHVWRLDSGLRNLPMKLSL